MRLSLNYFGVLFLVASICRFVFFFYDKVEVTPTIRMRSSEISCDKILWLWQDFVTGHSVLRDSQKVQTSLHRQWLTQYAHTGDFTMGYARRPAAYRAAPGIKASNWQVSQTANPPTSYTMCQIEIDTKWQWQRRWWCWLILTSGVASRCQSWSW